MACTCTCSSSYLGAEVGRSFEPQEFKASLGNRGRTYLKKVYEVYLKTSQFYLIYIMITSIL
jgi:hypothetical protein